MVEQTTQAAWTVGALLQWTENYFRERKLESARLDAQVLLAFVLKCSRPQLYVRFEEHPAEAARAEFRELIRRRIDGTPVAYLTGKKEFYTLSFDVTPDVLIPRPETETLVLSAITKLKDVVVPRILDLCCGSGCVAVAIANQLKASRVVATDISTAAIEVAQRNSHKHKVEDRVVLRLGDLYAALQLGELFHAIVANPPYIRTADIETLAPDVRDREPRLALDGGPDGLTIIDRIIRGAGNRLEPAGWLMVEIGLGQESDTIRKFQVAEFVCVSAISDAAGIPRVVIGQRAR